MNRYSISSFLVLLFLILSLSGNINSKLKITTDRIEKLEKFSVLKFQLCEDKEQTKCEKYRAYDLGYGEPTEEGLMTYTIRYVNERHIEQFLDTIRQYLIQLEEDNKRKVDEAWQHDTQEKVQERETKAE